MKVIQIDGIKGLITTLFIGVCLFAGFVIFPGQVAMSLWNKYLVALYMFPTLNLFQGVLLWAMVAITYCIAFKQGLSVSFKSTPELSQEEIDSIVKSAKINSQMRFINKSVSRSDRFELSKRPTIIKSVKNDKDSTFVSTPISTEDSAKKIEESNESTVSSVD